ncbi:hypothetical protein BGZ80_000379 [Entomortierella chlamydospora]|uniref:Uncharacterized protein n=1 Tax=Entomortierella chlamydospora TaxID=101097 RepID=A0A9P6MSH7_9FUNG|nr:hypothetical protein BGZ80_000379 [Entomortierella chlamydospora]
MHDCQAILPTVSALSADKIAVMDYLAINGVKDEYLSTWLKRQGLDGHGHNFAIESPLHKTGDIIEEQSIFLPESTLNSNSRINYSNRRRTSSLVNSDTSENISQFHCYSEEERYQRYDQTADHAMQLQYYPAQRFSYVDHHAQIHPFRHRRHSSLPAPSVAYGPQTVSADELAWKRHYFYQRQQYEEEEQALRILRKKLQDQAQSSGPRQLNQDTVTRAGSLNRLSSPSLLSKETSRILGLCRSSTLSAGTTKKNSATKEDFNSRSRATSFSSSLDQSQDIDTAKASINGDALLKTSTPVSLSRKKTLKEHLTPSLRSLARHCSSRFGGGRPNSFAGTKSDPVTECTQNRRSLCSQPSVNSPINSGHMSDFKPLKVGPETSELLRQRQQEDYQRILFPERAPVSLSRSKSTRVSSSTSLPHGITVIRADTLPLSNKRNSQGSIKCRGLASPEISDAHLDIQQYASPAAIPALVSIYESAPDVKERDSVKKQIASIFSLAWMGGKSSKNLPSQPLPARAANCLSPLAVEAQDYVPEHEPEQEEVIEDKIDSAEHFSFMLVPRSQYEFQPLTAQ